MNEPTATSSARLDGRTLSLACIGCDTRFVHISGCAALRRERSKSSQGMQELTTTQRYMHLSPAAVEGAIRLLDQPRSSGSRGDIIVETASEATVSC